MLPLLVVAGALLGLVLLLAWWARSRTRNEESRSGRGIAWFLYVVFGGGAILLFVILLIAALTQGPR